MVHEVIGRRHGERHSPVHAKRVTNRQNSHVRAANFSTGRTNSVVANMSLPHQASRADGQWSFNHENSVTSHRIALLRNNRYTRNRLQTEERAQTINRDGAISISFRITGRYPRHFNNTFQTIILQTYRYNRSTGLLNRNII